MKALKAWRILCWLIAPACANGDSLLRPRFWFQQVSLGQCKQRDYWSWAQHPASQENMQSTWGKTSFTSSVFLNLDFIIKAQIQAPKTAHAKFSLIKNMHFHLFIGYKATITFQFKNVAIDKKISTDWRFRFQLLCSHDETIVDMSPIHSKCLWHSPINFISK